MDLVTCDVLVVGGGGAGLRAAIAVAETHPRLRVAVIPKVYPMRSHTVSAERGTVAGATIALRVAIHQTLWRLVLAKYSRS